MIRRPPRSTRTDTLFPYTTLFRSSTYTARLIADFGVPAASIRVIEPVVDLDAFRRNAPSASLRQRYGLGDGPLLLTVCRLVARKGVDQVIAAVEIGRVHV